MHRVVPLLFVIAVVVAGVVFSVTLPPPGDGLTGRTWQWTATTAADSAAPSPVPDPGAYQLAFERGRTIHATADCQVVTGTFRTYPAGRMGPHNQLVIRPSAPASACGTGSLATAYVADLARSVWYRIAGNELTITLAGGDTMTFR